MKSLMFLLAMILPVTMTTKSVYDFTMEDINGNKVSLGKYEGKVLVIVNVASKCGFTPQYEDLQQFYEKYKERGVVVLGFPANNFLGQEPGTDEEIKQFCTSNYGVTFPMFSKISVKGKDQHPLYQYLTEKSQNGVLDAPVKWNFQKFLVDKKGQVIEAIEPKRSILDKEVIAKVEQLAGE